MTLTHHIGFKFYVAIINFNIQIILIIKKFILVTFGSLPFWPPINEEIENLLNTNEYTFHDRQFYYTFIM